MNFSHHYLASGDPIEQSDICPARCPLRQDGVRLSPPIHVPPPNPNTKAERVEAANRIYITKVQRWQTRILVLQPGQLNDELVADPVVVDMILGEGVVAHDSQTIITYSALSYAWGAPVYDQRITMNGQSYPITEHLYRALQRIRNESSNTEMWIDALCINQQDNSERSTQVANMLAIYWRASQVLVWLGDMPASAEHSKAEALAIDYLDSMHTPIYDFTDGGVNPDDSRRLASLHSDDCVAQALPLLNGLYCIYGRPW